MRKGDGFSKLPALKEFPPKRVTAVNSRCCAACNDFAAACDKVCGVCSANLSEMFTTPPLAR